MQKRTVGACHLPLALLPSELVTEGITGTRRAHGSGR